MKSIWYLYFCIVQLHQNLMVQYSSNIYLRIENFLYNFFFCIVDDNNLHVLGVYISQMEAVIVVLKLIKVSVRGVGQINGIMYYLPDGNIVHPSSLTRSHSSRTCKWLGGRWGCVSSYCWHHCSCDCKICKHTSFVYCALQRNVSWDRVYWCTCRIII